MRKKKISLNNPEYVKIGDKKYKINTDFRVAIKCNEIAQDDSIGDKERALAIIYKLFGDEGLNDEQNWQKLLELAKKYLILGKESTNAGDDNEIDMDFSEDMAYIEASFMSDYKIDLANTKMHWWKFYSLLEGLSNSEFGDCCILNRIRNLRTMDISKISDVKERERLAKAQEMFRLKKNKHEVELTKEQEESMKKLDEIIGFKK